MDAKTVSERTHEGTMKVQVMERSDGQAPRFSIDYSGTRMMNLGHGVLAFTSAQDAQAAADLAVERTGHRCYWACSNWS